MIAPAAASWRTARPFPEGVPILVDAVAEVTLRATEEADLPAMVEQCRDPETMRWSTTIPRPVGGYQLSDAQDFLAAVRAGWQDGTRLTWTVEAERDGARQFCGAVTLVMAGAGWGEIGFVLHPGARGRSVISSAVRLVRDYAFDALGLNTLRWRAKVGNWASRRVAAAAGFVFDGLVRRLLDDHGELVDGWVATMTRDDPRTPVRWLQPVELAGPGVALRPFAESDVERIIEACSDPRTRHWLVSMPHPYRRADALTYLEATRELAARGTGVVWCVADPDDGRCLGSIGLEGLGTYAPRGEIGYWAHPDARGRGLITEAVKLVSAHARSAGLASSIMIRCAAENTASRHAAEAAGYRQVGVLPAAEPLGDGSLADLVLYASP